MQGKGKDKEEAVSKVMKREEGERGGGEGGRERIRGNGGEGGEREGEEVEGR